RGVLLDASPLDLQRGGEGDAILAAGRPRDALGDRRDLDELVGLDGRASGLVLLRACIEAVGDQVAAGARELLDALPGAVVVGLNEAAGRDEGRGAAFREPDGGEPYAVEPSLVGTKAVGPLDLVG